MTLLPDRDMLLPDFLQGRAGLRDRSNAGARLQGGGEGAVRFL